jgi:uncharacterized protein YjeT (DUF2065 family)
MTNSRWITAFQYAAGLGDTCTGLLLVLAPELAARLMHVTILPSPIVFLSYIGIFVLCVGLSYLWVAWITSLGWGSASVWQTQWVITGLIRSSVAIFLAISIATGRLDPAWTLVALTDGVIACVQWLGMYRGWLSHEL